MSRHLLPLTASRRTEAHAWVDRALTLGRDGQPWVMEIREAKRSDDQNRALWSLLGQIAKQRPHHNGVKMDAELYKAVFLNALGAEMKMVPTLDGTGFFPLGQRSSQLTKGEFSDLITLILAWCAQEGLEVEHFDAANDAGRAA